MKRVFDTPTKCFIFAATNQLPLTIPIPSQILLYIAPSNLDLFSINIDIVLMIPF